MNWVDLEQVRIGMLTESY